MLYLLCTLFVRDVSCVSSAGEEDCEPDRSGSRLLVVAERLYAEVERTRNVGERFSRLSDSALAWSR